MNLKQAGKELVRGFGSAAKALTSRSQTLGSSTYRGLQDYWFWGNDGTEIHFSYSSLKDSVKAYQECPVVSAIINRQAQAYVNGKTWVLSTQGKGKGKEPETEQAIAIRRLLIQRPNPFKNGKQFEAEGYIYRRLFGYNVILCMKPSGFNAYKSKTLWNIPPYMLDIRWKKIAFFNAKNIKDCIESIHMDYAGTRTSLPLEDIMIIADLTVSLDNAILPDSRIRSLVMPINNIIGAYSSRNVLINKRGPLSIISSNKSDDSGKVSITPKEQKDLEKDFQHNYGVAGKQMLHVLTSAPVEVHTIGFATRDLMLMEEVVESAKALCDGLNYPPHLLGLIDPSFNNQKEANKGLYENCIIPDAESIYEQYNEYFNTAEYNLAISKDFSHLAALQEDDLKKAQSRRSRNDALQIEFFNNMLNLNRWCELNGEDPIPGEEGKMYYYQLVAKGWQFGKSGGISIQTESESSTNNNSNGTEQQ